MNHSNFLCDFCHPWMHQCFQWNLQGCPSWALTDTLTPSSVLQVKEKQLLPSDRLERWRRMWNPEASHWPCTWLAPGNGPGIPRRWWQSLWKQEDGWLPLPKWKKEVSVWHWVYIQHLNRQSIIKTVSHKQSFLWNQTKWFWNFSQNIAVL